MFVMGTQFLIVGICGFRMHFKMNELLKNLSEAHRKLQKQFFMSLVLQVRNIKLEQIRVIQELSENCFDTPWGFYNWTT